MSKEDYYGAVATERRKQFNNIIRGIDMVLMNNIPEVDQSVYDNWQGDSPLEPEECQWDSAGDKMVCKTHYFEILMTDEDWDDDDTELKCDYADDDVAEIYQWYAVGDSDAEFLKRHGQYITYSDLLDTYFLAITHYGTAWDYVDSMVHAFDDCYHLDDVKESK